MNGNSEGKRLQAMSYELHTDLNVTLLTKLDRTGMPCARS